VKVPLSLDKCIKPQAIITHLKNQSLNSDNPDNRPTTGYTTLKKSGLFLFTLLTLQWFCAIQPSSAAALPPAPANSAQDIRVLIDVSGSMKKNDPGNLRAPALRLLTGLLPAGSQAGVWTFGRYVNMLVPYGTVDTAWREQATTAADRINSAGLYTDIGAALDKATWNWTASAPGARRSLILLTDGLVDVSDDAAADLQSRGHITDQILPRLRDAGVAVYTVALSDGADEALLQQLSATTGGWFERADRADKLERIFFRMFEKAANPDTLPLVDNKVLVDSSIDELTLLIFRKENAPATTVTMPDGTAFDQTRLPPNAHWHNDARYDLITIEKPTTGTWHVNADVDPDNRVMVVSNLRVVATQLPNQILHGDAQDFFVRFTEQGHAITKKEFLNFLKVNVRESGDRGEPSEQLLLDNGRDDDAIAGDGIFSTRLAGDQEAGHHTITVDVDGTTFRRQHRQDIEIVESPVIAEIHPNAAGATILSVIPRATIVNSETVEVTASITGDKNLSESRRLMRSSPGEWQLDLKNYPAEGSYQITLDVEAERLNGKPISYHSKPLHFGRAAVAPAAEPVPVTAGEPPATEQETPAETAADEPAATETVATEDTEESDDTAEPAHTNWILVISLVVLLNVVMAGGLYLGYRKFFRARTGTPAGADEAGDTGPAASAAAAVTTAMDNTQPSIVTQVAEAAAAEARGDDPEAAAQTQVDAATVAADTIPAQPGGDVAEPAGAAPDTDSSPEFVIEDAANQAAAEEPDDSLQTLNVDEIDLGFEEKARNTG
jgi:uncharacterized protein (TIGR03503 family)